tara:strand:+ start:599 stop:730 length:132 start_codon:yes stop_codon:yes gene_type:complete
MAVESIETRADRQTPTKTKENRFCGGSTRSYGKFMTGFTTGDL